MSLPIPSDSQALLSDPPALLALLNERSPKLGEIRYFPSQPTDQSWLACDGKSYLRSSYPEYEVSRPRAGLVASLGIGSPARSGYGVTDSTYYYRLINNSRHANRTADGSTWEYMADWLPDNVSYKAAFALSDEGDLLFIPDGTTGAIAYYKPNGGSWVATPALPNAPSGALGLWPTWTMGTFLPSGKCVFVKQGGRVAGKYSPVTNTWETITLSTVDRAWGNLAQYQNDIIMVDYANVYGLFVIADVAFAEDYIGRGCGFVTTVGENSGMWGHPK